MIKLEGPTLDVTAVLSGMTAPELVSHEVSDISSSPAGLFSPRSAGTNSLP